MCLYAVYVCIRDRLCTISYVASKPNEKYHDPLTHCQLQCFVIALQRTGGNNKRSQVSPSLSISFALSTNPVAIIIICNMRTHIPIDRVSYKCTLVFRSSRHIHANITMQVQTRRCDTRSSIGSLTSISNESRISGVYFQLYFCKISFYHVKQKRTLVSILC